MKKRIIAIVMVLIMVASLLPASAFAASATDPSAPIGTVPSDPTGHTHNWVWNTTKEPTCTEQGEMEGRCYACGAYQHSTIPALGHDWGEWEVTKPAGCLTDGEKEHVCRRCGLRETEVIPAHGHLFGEWYYVDYPNSEGIVVLEHKCVYCGLTEQKEEKITILLEIVSKESTEGKQAGDYIDIVYKVTNTSNETVTINGYRYHTEDGKFAFDDCLHDESSKLSFLGPGESAEFSINTHISQDDIDNGYISRDVQVCGKQWVANGHGWSASMTGFDSNVVYPSASFNGKDIFGFEDEPDPPVLLVYKGVLNSPADEHFHPGETIVFEICVTNPTDWYMGEVSVYDILTGETKTVTLADHDSKCVYFSYQVTDMDAINTYVNNQAIASNYMVGDILSNIVHLPIDPFKVAGELTVTKKISNSPQFGPYFTEGETINFEITVTNNTNTVLNTVSIYDIYAPGSLKDVKFLNPGESISAICPYVVGPGDIGSGSMTNVAFGEAWDDYGNFYNGSAEINVQFKDKVTELPTIVKSEASSPNPEYGYYTEGDVVTYDITVTNTTGETIYNVSVADPLMGLPIVANYAQMAPNETRTGSYSYTVTKDNVEAGSISNTAGVSATTGTGEGLSNFSNTVVVRTGPKNPGNITIYKNNTNWSVVAARGYYTVADGIGYEIGFINTTGGEIYNVKLYDPAVQSAPLYEAASVPVNGAYVTYKAHIVTVPDCIAKSYTNTAWINYLDSDGFSHTMYSPSVTVPTDMIADGPKVSITKVETSTPGVKPNGIYYGENETITYTITVTNTGNVDLYNCIISDSNQGHYGGQLGVIAHLPVNATQSFPYSHVVNYTDVHSYGYVENLAAVVATDPTGQKILEISNPVYSPCNENPVPNPPEKIPPILEGDDYCVKTLNADNEGDMGCTVENCSEHGKIDAQILDMVSAAADADGRKAAWERAQELWTDEIDKLYDILLDYIDDSYYCLITMNDRNMFYAQLESFEASLNEIFPNDGEAVARLVATELKNECVELCWLLHNSGLEPASEMVADLNALRMITGGACDLTALESRPGYAQYLLDLCGVHRGTGEATASLIGSTEMQTTVTGNLDWTRLSNMWMTEYSAVMDARYAAASGSLKDKIKAEHINYLTWIDCHRSFMDMFYDNQITRDSFLARVLMERTALSCSISEGITTQEAGRPYWANPGISSGKDSGREGSKFPGWLFGVIGVAAVGGAGGVIAGKKKKSGKGGKKEQ